MAAAAEQVTYDRERCQGCNHRIIEVKHEQPVITSASLHDAALTNKWHVNCWYKEKQRLLAAGWRQHQIAKLWRNNGPWDCITFDW